MITLVLVFRYSFENCLCEISQNFFFGERVSYHLFAIIVERCRRSKSPECEDDDVTTTY